MSAAPAKNAFTATRWSLVLSAGRPEAEDIEAALKWLCERYWFPIFAYVRGRGHQPAEAEDLVQAFFAWLLDKNVVARADIERGRFRSFLLGCLNNFLAQEWKKEHSQKRGGGATLISLDDARAEERLQSELVAARNPALDYDRAWALTLIDRVLEQLRAECEDDGHAGRFETLQSFLHGERGEISLNEAATSLGLSLAAVKSVIHRLRQRFRGLLFAEVRETVASDEEVPAELQQLLAALS
jgi:RNA polymerase sigma-70 factor (ECF subfamily)